jgi:hypothetical protein
MRKLENHFYPGSIDTKKEIPHYEPKEITMEEFMEELGLGTKKENKKKTEDRKD